MAQQQAERMLAGELPARAAAPAGAVGQRGRGAVRRLPAALALAPDQVLVLPGARPAGRARLAKASLRAGGIGRHREHLVPAEHRLRSPPLPMAGAGSAALY